MALSFQRTIVQQGYFLYEECTCFPQKKNKNITKERFSKLIRANGHEYINLDGSRGQSPQPEAKCEKKLNINPLDKRDAQSLEEGGYYTTIGTIISYPDLRLHLITPVSWQYCCRWSQTSDHEEKITSTNGQFITTPRFKPFS